MRTQIVAELMNQASGYKALGKVDEARDIYERIVKRTDYCDEEAIIELATLCNQEEYDKLYETAAFYALARFDKKAFITYCGKIQRELSFAVTSKAECGGSIEVAYQGKTLEVEKDTIHEKLENSQKNEENKDLPLVEDSGHRIASKRKKSLPEMNDIADVLQSGGVEQALYMLDKLEVREGQVRDLWYLRALCYVSNGDMKSAKNAIETELGLYPDNGKAKRLAVDINRVVGKKSR